MQACVSYRWILKKAQISASPIQQDLEVALL